jgi:hypothetical protein
MEESLQRIIKNTNAARAVILEIDGFDYAKAKKTPGDYIDNPKILSSVVLEAHNSEISPIFNHWQNMRLDKTYMNLISEILKKDYLVVDSENREVINGKIRNVYESFKVSKSMVFVLKKSKRKLFYISINYQDSEIPPYDWMIIQGETDIIKNLL